MSRKMHIIPSLTMSLVLMTCVITKANDNSNNTNILINENVTAISYVYTFARKFIITKDIFMSQKG